MPKKQIIPDEAAYAKRFGKLDTERLGVFIEMPYFSDKARAKKYSIGGLRTMLPGGPKTKCGTMDGYFDNEFKRIFSGDRGNKKDKYASRLQSRGPFLPGGYPKKHSCPGDYFGCFSGIIPAVSRRLRPVKGTKTSKPNPITGPGKKGGPGYPNICFSKYPEYKPPRYRPFKTRPPSGKPAMIPYTYPKPYFDPNIFTDPKPPTKRLYIKPKEKLRDVKMWTPVGPTKWLGGCKAGCFDKWPEWRDAKSFKKKKVYQPKFVQKALPFVPQSYGEKTMFTRPTLLYTEVRVNSMNWKTATPEYVEYLVENVYVKK